jgi:hypothetical protein
MRSNQMLLFILILGLIISGCLQDYDRQLDKGSVFKNGIKSKVIASALNPGDIAVFQYLSLQMYRPLGAYAYGSVSLYNIPFEVGTYDIQPKPYDTLNRRYILDSVYSASYVTLDIDALVNFFRLTPDHPVNEFKILEIKKPGYVKGSFSLAFDFQEWYV